MTVDDGEPTFVERVYTAVHCIPEGRVATYGQIADLAGRPRAARQVGYAMHRCPANLPWHRVVNAQGRLSLPADSDSGRMQRQRLESEGVVLIGGRIDLSLYGE
ncbi:MAG: MGMT family protein [Salinisphaera sp.]|jgi:methylated-DNA-protein-cysteine methyltransferase-like protein|nr:MGMT family protein [Salinisphaera sp.]